jgi:hypothetical protein
MEPVLAPNEGSEVIIKNVPSLDVIEAELQGDPVKVWHKGYQQNALYLARGDMKRRPPTLISLAEGSWESLEPEPKVHVQNILEQGTLYPDLAKRDEGLRVVNLPGATVAALAVRGAYNRENILAAFAKLQAYLVRTQKPAAGDPRLLIYDAEDWMPEKYKLMEVQIPVPAVAE